MGEAIHVAGTENEAPAELEGILAEASLLVTGGIGTFASCLVVASEDVQQSSGAKPRNAIGRALRVHQEREGDAGVLAEKAGVVLVAEPDGGKVCALFAKRLFVFAQLRDVLAAEHSTIVSQKHDHCRTIRPQRAELNRMVVCVGQDDPRKLRAER